MRTKMLSIFIFILCFGILSGCSILDADVENYKGTMQAKVNGDLIIFDEAYGDRILQDDFTWSKILYIVGKTDLKVSGHEIQFDFPLNPMKGLTYHPSCMYRPWIGDYYNYNQTAYITKAINTENLDYTSTVTFTSIENSRYKGTFSFKAYIVDQNLKDSIVVTEGVFEIDSDGRKW